MQKVLFVIGVFVLGAFMCCKTMNAKPMIDDLLLKNVEALASEENTVIPPTICNGTGHLICPGIGERVKYVVQGFGLR